MTRQPSPMESLLDILRRIDAGELTPEAAIARSHEAIAAREPEIRAIAHLNREATPAHAGPLRGIALGVKDIIDTADLPTEYGTTIYRGWRPKADASVVAAARRAGATIMAKTVTTPLAYLDPAETRNPHHIGHTPGGSSSGSAAAVAAGMLPLALGSQTGGSVIRPASFCGVVGVKPSYRLIPTVGVKTFSWALDTLGLFAATVADAAFALAALTDRPELRLDDRPPAGAPRIGVVVQDFAESPEPASVTALETAIHLAEGAGASVKPVSLPPLLAEAFRIHPLLQDYEAARALAWEYDHHRNALPPLIARCLGDAQEIPTAAYDDARRISHRARGALGEVFADVDVLLTYAAPGAAPAGLASTGNARFNRLWTLMGNPCVAVPGLADGAGLPVGVQVIAPFGDDEVALAAASFLETALRRG